MAEVVEGVVTTRGTGTTAERERTIRQFEQAVGLRRHTFARERVGRSHLVTCTALQAGSHARMPVRRVTWSITFLEGEPRDNLFAWLAGRVDRWDDWGEMAYQKGAEALTQHILSLLVSHEPKEPRS